MSEGPVRKPAQKVIRPRVGNERGVFRMGTSQIKRVGLGRWYWGDIYHWMLTLSWPRFFLLVGGLYMVTNVGFALAFFLVPGSVSNARPGSFLDTFFFSIETLATVGYGYMNPGSTYGHVVASTEILLGMVEVATVTGLLFARFSRPTSRIMFSDVAVITPFNGVPTLMLRTGNERGNLILEASVRATLIRREMTLEGQIFTRFYDLQLERERSGVFALTWTILHKIDESSPFWGKSQEDLQKEGATLSVAVSGTDDTLNDFVHARQTYAAEHIFFNHHFADIMSDKQDGNVRILDYSKFHDIYPDGTTGGSMPGAALAHPG
ncbi:MULTISPECIES: ion channel [unclassified Duganella]|uniref:ion channel n=1 Tax=unclassified Duganella TaxID=2636909 RepID=UPI000E3518A5|nr:MULTISPECIES: ion channel [unclassified Duganella]RFP19067.1 ATP-sensitive inward rectifier potassium channel 10 [Duganella sp. BJB475]RFP35729.1 ATP-sensitive inward rectifier potassium channel 10 [Duganella sp. BJB476]